MKKLLVVMVVVFVSQILVAQDWYVSQDNYDQGFCVPVYVDSLGGITLLNMNYISLSPTPLVLLDEGMFVPTVTELEEGWKKIFVEGPINAEIFRYIMMSYEITPREELTFRDDLEKAIIIFKESENERDTFFVKIVPAIEGEGKYSLEEIEEGDFSQKVVIVDEGEPIPVFIRK